MSNLAVSTITKALTKQFIIKLMKITQFRKNEDTIALSVMDLDILVNKIKTEIKSRPVSTFREHLRYVLSDERCMFADKLPKIIPAAEFRKVNGQKQMKNYNGIVELTIGPLSNKSEIALVKQKACEQPQTRCVFMGSSGKTVKIWATFTRPDNSLPKTREEAELFHAHAYRLAVKCYQPQIPFDILPKEPTLEQYSRLSHDPDIIYRPDSVQFYLSQPSSMPEETTFREAVQAEKSPLTRAVPGYDAENAFLMLFEAAFRKAYADLREAGLELSENTWHPLVVQLAKNCFASGLPQEEVVRRTVFHFYMYKQEELIRQMIGNIYTECKGFGKNISLSKEQQLALQTEEFMKRRYEFRHNTQIGEVEYRERLSFRFRFNPLDKRALNSIALDAQKVFRCGTGILVVIFTPIACLYSTRWKIFSTGFPHGTVKTVSVHWQPPSLVRIRIGWICSTVGSSIWFLIGKEATKSMQTVFLPYSSDRKEHVNPPFAGA